jgi:hypothetical protein
VRVTKDGGESQYARVHGTASEHTVVFEDDRTGANYNVYLAKLAADGSVKSEARVWQVKGTPSLPALAPANNGHLLAWQNYLDDGWKIVSLLVEAQLTSLKLSVPNTATFNSCALDLPSEKPETFRFVLGATAGF